MHATPAFVRSVLAAAAIWSLVAAGCASVPRIDPTGERIFSWEPRPAPVVSAPGVPVPVAIAAPGLTLTPARIIAPVGSEVLMVAGVHGPGQPNMTGQRVEWLLAPGSVGHFLAVGESERPRLLRLTAPPQKVSNDYAVSETQATPRVITRGTVDPIDDVSVMPGQAWVTLASPVEGTSHVTAFAPDIQGALANRQSGVIHWVDVRWLSPTSSQAPIGQPHSLVTTVMRASSGAPIAGYKVRYEVAGGAEAGFGPSQSGGVELTTNEEGRAAAELSQPTAVAGQTQVNVQVIRPAIPPASGEPLVIGSTTIAVDWLPLSQPVVTPPVADGASPGAIVPQLGPATAAPSQPASPPAGGGLEVRVISPTQEVAVGGQAEFRIEITNRTAVALRKVTVLDRFDAGLEHSVSPSPIQRNIGEVGPGETRLIGLTFTVRQPGRQCHKLEVTAEGGLRATAEGCVTATGVAAEIAEQPSIKLVKTGPAQMKSGDTAMFKIEVSNVSDQPINNLRVSESWNGGLKPLQATDGNEATGANEITWNYARPLQPGATVVFEVQYQALAAQNENCTRASASAGDDTASDEHCVEITGPAAATGGGSLSIVLSDSNDSVPAGTPFSYRIIVSNSGATPQENVALVVEVPETINLNSIQAPVQTQNVKTPVLRFPPVRLLEPGKLVTYVLNVTGARTGRQVIRAQVSSQAVTTPVTAEESTNVTATK